MIKDREPELLTYIEAASELSQLRAEILRHNQLYYDQDTPEISDEDYDALMRRLRALEAAWPQLASNDSPSQVVGGSTRRTLRGVAHRVPMLSLQDVFSEGEVRDFVKRLQEELGDPVFVVER